MLAAHGLTGQRPVLLYAPTGEACNSLETMGVDVIRRLAGNGRYDLLIKPHDHPKNTDIDWYARLAPFEDAHTRFVRNRDVVPLLSIADLLITDASSVANEFTLLNRPIVFLDVPELFRRSREAGAQLDLETWGRRGGIVVERAAEVEDAVASSLAMLERGAEIRAEIARDLFFNPGHATDAAISWFSARFLTTRAVQALALGRTRPALGGVPALRRRVLAKRGRKPKKIAYYLRHCGNLHYFAALKPYLDHFLQHSPHDNRIIVRGLAPEHHDIPEYADYAHLFTTDCDLDAYDLVLTPTFLREDERSARCADLPRHVGQAVYLPQRLQRLPPLSVHWTTTGRSVACKPAEPGIRIATVGYPKFETAGAAPKLFANGKKTLIYCPTWRKGDLSSVHRFLDDPQVLAEIVSEYNLIVKPHPNLFNPERVHYDESIVERLQRLPGIKLIRSGNVMPWFAQADLLLAIYRHPVTSGCISIGRCCS